MHVINYDPFRLMVCGDTIFDHLITNALSAQRIMLHAVCSGNVLCFKVPKDVQKRKLRVLGANFKVIKCGEHGSCPDGEASTTC